MKSVNDRGSGLIEAYKIMGFGRLASVASTFYKLNKIKSRCIKVFSLSLASLVCLHRSFELIVFKSALAHFIQCNLAAKFTSLTELNNAIK